MQPEPQWEISDIDGSNRRRVTLAQYRAELDERKRYAAAISVAFWRGDMAGMAAAQAAFRAKFGEQV